MSIILDMVLGYVGCLVAFLLISLACKKKKANDTYDERQEIVRGRAYRYGFFTLLAGVATEVVFDLTEIMISREQFVLFGYFILMAGIGVFAVYSIWNDAYLTESRTKKSSMILFTVIGLVNVAVGISNFFNSHGDKIVYSVNFFVAALMIVAVITFLLKDLIKKEEEE